MKIEIGTSLYTKIKKKKEKFTPKYEESIRNDYEQELCMKRIGMMYETIITNNTTINIFYVLYF